MSKEEHRWLEIDDFFECNEEIRKDMELYGLVVVKWDSEKKKPVRQDPTQIVLMSGPDKLVQKILDKRNDN